MATVAKLPGQHDATKQKQNKNKSELLVLYKE